MNKQIRKQKLLKFRNEYLPEIESIFYVEGHGPSNAPNTMYKIIINDILNFDYYPMSERIQINENKLGRWQHKWGDCDPQRLLKEINKINEKYLKQKENISI